MALATKGTNWGWMKSVIEEYFSRWKNVSIFNVRENKGMKERVKYTKYVII